MRPREERRFRDRLQADTRLLGIKQEMQFRIILNLLEHQRMDIERLRRALEADTNATNAAVKLMQQMTDDLRKANEGSGNTTDEVNRILDQYEANTKALADAVTAQTPADPNAGSTSPGQAAEDVLG